MGVVVGSFSIPVTTGNVTVGGMPFEPVGVLFWNIWSVHSEPGMMMGAATSTTDQWIVWTGMDVETNTYNKRFNEGRTDCCIYNLAGPFTTIQYQAELVSFNSDGFTVNFTTRNGTGGDICYMAIGGQHITAAHAGLIYAGGATGTTSTTDPGFEPSALIIAHQSTGAFDIGMFGDMKWGVGVTDGVGQYGCWAMGDQGAVLDAYEHHRTNGIACASDGTNTYHAELSSFDANGFTINVSDAWNANIAHAYLAIEADAAGAGHGVQPDSPGTQTVTGLSLKPDAVFFCWNGADTPTTGGSFTKPVRPGVGAFSEFEERASSLIFRDEAPFGVFSPDGYQTDAGILIVGVDDGISDPPAHDEQGVGVYDDFQYGSFTIDWTFATSGADRAYGWLALPGEIQFHWIPNLYRRQLP